MELNNISEKIINSNLNNSFNKINEPSLDDKKGININDIKKQILKNIKSIKKNECIEIFKIIKENNINFTENMNGIFIDLNLINDNILIKINNFINFIISKNKELIETEKIINKNKKKFGINNNNN